MTGPAAGALGALVDGATTPGDGALAVRDPRRGVTDAWIVPATVDDLDAAVGGLRREQPAWEEMGVVERARRVAALADALDARRAELVEALVADTGRLGETHMEIDATIGGIRRWAAQGPELLAPPEPRPAAIPFVTVSQTTRPYPVVAVISPWNFPLLLGLIDAVPALVAGCAAVVKPSEVTPRFVVPLRAAIDDAGLSSVLAVALGDGRVGSALVERTDAVCFTGSVATGRRVAVAAAERFIPAFLELGGKDAALVLDDADLDRASSAVLWGSTANCGQSCQSIERVYVVEAVADDFVERLVAKADGVRLAVPGPGDGDLGPIISVAQVAIIERHLSDAVERGAVVRSGGVVETIDGGSYLRPTVLTGVDHTMAVMAEETFGPVIPVMVVADADAAVEAANDSDFGLSGAVFSGSVERAREVASRLDAGGISINDASLTALVHDGEKHSFRLSGLGGSRMGPASLWRFVRKQAHLANGLGPAPDPWWFPHLQGG